MTQEEKELLLKDLSARLYYGVKVTYNISGSHYEEISTICGWELQYDDLISFKLKNGLVVGCNIKPYLRPMSSMTEDEKLDYITLGDIKRYTNPQYAYLISEQLDYLNAHHFDFRGLIPMGLALEAPEDMYKFD